MTNFSSVPQDITITYHRSNGTPISVNRMLAARGALRETARDLFGFGLPAEDGWIQVVGTAPLGGFIAYGYSATGGVAVVPVQTIPRTTMVFAHVANGPLWGTGIALLNTTTATATVEVFVMRKTGALVGGAADVPTASISLPPGRKIARLLDDLVPASTNDDGFVYVRTTNNVPIYGFEVFFSRDNRVIANVAASSLDPALGYEPPSPSEPLPVLTISSLNPARASAQSTIEVIGTGFSPLPGDNSVVFRSATGTVTTAALTATTTVLTAAVPAAAITGPVYVITNDRFSPSSILEVVSNSSTLLSNTVKVTAGQSTTADVYVPPSAAFIPLNATTLALTETTQNFALTTDLSVAVTTNVTKRLWIEGNGISTANGTKVTISGGGISITPFQVQEGLIIVHITVLGSAAPGPRNIALTNSNLDVSVITGGLIVQ